MVTRTRRKMIKNNNILYGMEQIRPVVGNATEVTIMKWHREYDSFPMRKLGGQWVSHREELNIWWRAFVQGNILPAKIDEKPVKKRVKKRVKNPMKKQPKKTVSSKS